MVKIKSRPQTSLPFNTQKDMLGNENYSGTKIRTVRVRLPPLLLEIITMKTYGDLYSFIASNLDANNTIDTFDLMYKFCKNNHIRYSHVLQIVSEFGASNDIEILYNVSRFIDDDTPINTTIITPVQYAIENNYYTRWHEGMWVKCKAEDIGAMPDLNRAYAEMFDHDID